MRAKLPVPLGKVGIANMDILSPGIYEKKNLSHYTSLHFYCFHQPAIVENLPVLSKRKFRVGVLFCSTHGEWHKVYCIICK